MEKRYEDVYIERVKNNVKIRYLSPEEIEALETMVEIERECEFILQGIYDLEEFTFHLNRCFKNDLVSIVVSTDKHIEYFERVNCLRRELLEAIITVNQLNNLKFKNESVCVGGKDFSIRVEEDGKVYISGLTCDGK